VVPAVRPSVLPLMLLGLLLVAVPAVAFAGDTQPGRLDRWLQPAVGSSSPGAHDPALALDWLGEPTGRALLVLAVAAVCLIAGRRALAITTVVGSFLVAVLTTGLKYVVGREIHDGFLSYPSGHTAAFAAIGLVIGLLLADVFRTGTAAGTAIVLCSTVIAGALMAWSQITLTAHYPTDTVGGVGCALLVVPATGVLVDRFRRSGGTPA
jgi:membrane-associated phospholipid phosphatase